jgi:Leucine-rich repeat (LRR) protein
MSDIPNKRRRTDAEQKEESEETKALTDLRQLCKHNSVSFKYRHGALAIGSLVTLSTLKVSDSQLTDLPASIGNMKNLTKLCISVCGSLEYIPTEIWKLRKLKDLQINMCQFLTVLPNEIEFLSALQTLEIYFCNDLERLPSTIGALEQLEELRIY